MLADKLRRVRREQMAEYAVKPRACTRRVLTLSERLFSFGPPYVPQSYAEPLRFRKALHTLGP